MADSALKKMRFYAPKQNQHTFSSNQMDPAWEEYMRTNERINPNQGLEAPLLDPLDPFMLPKTLPVKAAKAYTKLAAEAIQRGVQSGHPAFAAMSPLNIIKNRGGNWLTGSVEDAFKNLNPRKRYFKGQIPTKEELLADPEKLRGQVLVTGLGPDPQRTFDRLARDNSLAKWIEGPLTKYVKRDMATPEDPIRKLADQGVLHYVPGEGNMLTRALINTDRLERGFPEHGLASTDLGKNWEHSADYTLRIGEAGKASPSALEQNPWLSKVQADDPIYQLRQDTGADLGFSHITDELANALNPDSGLPRNLLITPEQVQQMGIEKAVRHVDAINKWRAAQQAAADLTRANNPAVHTFKEYAENNPRGLKWVQLKSEKHQPVDAVMDEYGEWWPINSEGKRIVEPGGAGHGSRREAMESAFDPDLEDALKYEGDTMGHCVGGYCDDVIKGHSNIFSLRDAKGQPHVTIETDPHLLDMDEYTGGWVKGRMNQEDAIKAIRELEQNPDWQERVGKRISGGLDAWIDDIQQKNLGVPRIIQVKGKANQTPKEDYLPFVQDFVKSGKWGGVGDLRNTGLVRQDGSYFTPRELADQKVYYINETGGYWPNDLLGDGITLPAHQLRGAGIDISQPMSFADIHNAIRANKDKLRENYYNENLDFYHKNYPNQMDQLNDDMKSFDDLVTGLGEDPYSFYEQGIKKYNNYDW